MRRIVHAGTHGANHGRYLRASGRRRHGRNAAATRRRCMRIVYFTHSLRSCWNHGNAHFVRGVLSELARRGHDVRVFEPENAWSLANLIADHGEAGLEPFRNAYPELESRTYSRPE